MKNRDKSVQSDPLKQNPKNNPSPSTIGGPKFGLEDNESKGFRRLVEKYGSSIILPTIALLILAGGIYLYASQNREASILSLEQGTADIQQTISNGEQASLPSQIAEQEIEKIIGGTTEETAIREIVPESRKQGTTIIEKAIKGDGVTHLARRALKSYQADHPQELTNEHKIYIEDFLKDRIGSNPLEIGEEISFSEDLIKQAINASMELNEQQLENLKQYSALVVSW